LTDNELKTIIDNDSYNAVTRRSLIQALAPSLLLGQNEVRLRFPEMTSINAGGCSFQLVQLPKEFEHDADSGLVASQGMRIQVVHSRPALNDWCGEARATITPGGDYLLMFTAGKSHYGGHKEKVNDMVAYRSADRGRTWTGPVVAWKIPYNQHGFVPLTPHGGKRMYAFGTEPIFDRLEDRENAPIGYRTSDDEGHTWSPVTLIRPQNDPDYIGMFVMRMCETDRGTWLLAPHSGMSRNPRHTKVYVLRSEDHGRNWTLLPGARPQGWTEPRFQRMEEGRPVSLGGGEVLLITRTAEGHLWQLRSQDDGRTWSDPEPTPLIHPLAPPMIFWLSDGKTLAAFHHNRYSGGEINSPAGIDRSELWVSLSHDKGRTWTEPRFVLANANQPYGPGAFAYSVSYIDAIADAGHLHLIISHQFRQVVHIALAESLLPKLPARRDLQRLVG
jgi:hypothetical protein